MTTQPPSGFEGSYLGDDDRISDAAVMECGVCWQVYDPAEGDEYWQIPPGTAFKALPEHWTCPGCAAPKGQFMVQYDPNPPSGALPPVIETGSTVSAYVEAAQANAEHAPIPEDKLLNEGAIARAAGEDAALIAMARQVIATYRAADVRMRDIPLYEEHLSVALIGFQRYEIPGWGCVIGMLVTPWCLNLMLLPPAPQGWDGGLAPGDEEMRVLPAGRFPFVAAEVEGLGMVLSCSLFSPMGDFVSQEAACLTAFSALEEILGRGRLAKEEAAPTQPQPKPEKALAKQTSQAQPPEATEAPIDQSKRALFRGRLSRRER